ncbi:MAG TPA: hypothetical protein VFU76_08815, partial [Terriglobales bacterium]|nr:hypothetical protein [Terriglobales bacterium]
AYAHGGYPEVLRMEVQDKLRRRAAGEFVDAMSLADFYAMMGQTDKTLEWLQKAYQERSSGMIYLSVSPDLQPLKANPEFVRLLDTLHLSH